MATPNRRPDYAAIGFDAVVVSVSVSSSTSAAAAGVGPFAGLFFITSASCTIITVGGTSITVDNFAKNATLWIAGSFVSVIATATSIYALQ